MTDGPGPCVPSPGRGAARDAEEERRPGPGHEPRGGTNAREPAGEAGARLRGAICGVDWGGVAPLPRAEMISRHRR